MSFYCRLRNEALINELKHELNNDILLLGADGFSYFGRLQAIEDCRIAILTPAVAAETSEVEIVTPGDCIATVDFVRIDLWSLVGKGTGICQDPVYCPCQRDEADDDLCCGLPEADRDSDTRDRDRDRDCFIRSLKRLIGNNVSLTTVGGFLFQGVLSDVCNNLAILRVDEICIPGCSGYISEHHIRSAVVNLDALTSIAEGRTDCCC